MIICFSCITILTIPDFLNFAVCEVDLPVVCFFSSVEYYPIPSKVSVNCQILL